MNMAHVPYSPTDSFGDAPGQPPSGERGKPRAGPVKGAPPLDLDERVRPFLVLKLTPADEGLRPVDHGMQAGMFTLHVAQEKAPDKDVGFDLGVATSKLNGRYIISGEVTNLGKAAALMGIARLYIVNENQDFTLFGNSTTPIDMIDFQAPAGAAQRFRFKTWDLFDSPLNAGHGIIMYIHVMDLAGDASKFVVDSGSTDRHRVHRFFVHN